MFLAGPPAFEGGHREIATDEELGAQRCIAKAGTAEYLAEDDADGIRIAREIMSSLPLEPAAAASPPMSCNPVTTREEMLGMVLRTQEAL